MHRKRAYFTPALPRNRQVIGPQGDFGIIAKAAGHGKKRIENLDQRRNRNDDDRAKAQLRNQFKNDTYVNSFWSSTDVRSAVARIKRFVDKGLEAADDDLEMKRNRVKAILLEEEAALTQEYVDKAQKSADLQFKLKKKCAEDIESRKASEEKAFVEDAYNRIFESSNDEFRANRSSKLRQELNRIHKLQIRDKELMRLKEEEDTKMWLAIMDKEQKVKELREQGAMNQRKLNFEKNTEILRKQIFGIKLKRENESNLKKEEMTFWRDVQKHNEEEAELFQGDQKQEESSYWTALKEQREMNRHLRQKKEQEEKNIDQCTFDYNTAVLKDERDRQVDDRERERMEQHLFRESLKQFNAAMEDLENDSENFIKKKNAEKMAAKKELMQKASAMRKEFNLECVRERELQADMKRIINAEIARGNEMLLMNRAMRLSQNAELERVKLNKIEQATDVRARSINSELMKYQSVLEERTLREDREFLERLRQNQEKDVEKGKELLANPRRGILHPVMALHRAQSLASANQ